MKNWMNNYIEFLLVSHNCLVIPELGGFIVSERFDIVHSESSLLPRLTVAFNQELKHNDGILYASLQKYEGLSYEKACQKVQKEVAAIKSELRLNGFYRIGNIGTLRLNSENNIQFGPNENYIHPSVFGLSAVGLRRLEREEENIISVVEERRNYKIAYIAAAIAFIMFFIMPAFNNQGGQLVQQAGIVDLSANKGLEISKSIFDAVSEGANVESSVSENNDEVLPQVTTQSSRTYYIIIGSETNEHRRDILMKKFGEDFGNLSFVETDGRYRIYPASFDDKGAAEEFLLKFRAENPKYETAWLYSKKN